MEQRERDPREIRRFGFILGGLLCLFAALSWWRHGWIPWYALAAPGLVVLLMALFDLPVLRHVFRGWMTFAHALGWFQTRLILGLLFFLAITPLGWILRLFGHDPMQRRRRATDSYWEPREPYEIHPDRYRKQY
jgi:hypothetical protein